ncbi:MAG: MFS transporter [Spirochaetales bacterium]|nr:MFS transporter [Spirochaetales bacterium]
MNIRKLLGTYRGLDRSIYLLCLAQVVNSIGHFVHPFLTMFLTQKIGMDPVEAGTYVMLSAAAWVPGSLLGGRIADKVGRKQILVIFQSLAAAALVPCAFLGVSRIIPWLLIGSSFLQGAAEPVNDAMITDLTTAERRKRAFSLLYLSHNIGFALGPMIAGFLFTLHLAWIFLGDAITTGIAVILIAAFIRESAPTETQIAESFARDRGSERAERGSLIKVLVKRPFLVAFMFIHVILSFVYSQTAFGLPLQLSEVFGEGGARMYGTIMSFNAVVVIVLTTFLIHTTDRIQPALTVAVSSLFFAAGFGMIGVLRTLPLFLLSTLIWTVGEILEATNTSAYVANHSPITHRARINAVAPIIMWSGFALGPPLSARFIERFSLYRIWPLCLGLSMVAAVLLLGLHLVEKRARKRRIPAGKSKP